MKDLPGGDGSFLALPPQCVPDREILKMPSKVLWAWLGLLDVAWKSLDDRARQTLNTIVRLALGGQPFPEDVLALEVLRMVLAQHRQACPPCSLADLQLLAMFILTKMER